MDLANILDDCLQQLKAGRSVSQCLADYPDHATALAPMLQAALQVQALAGQRLSDGQRLGATVAMREALASRPSRRSRLGWLGSAPQVRGLVAATAAVLLLLIVVSTSVIASSTPGDLIYPLRVALERAPVLLQPDAAGQAQAELRAVDRRLADLQAHLAAAGGVDAFALKAVVQGHRAAAVNAGELTETERLQIATRMEVHARVMTQLAAQGLEPRARERVQTAAAESRTIAQRLRTNQPTPAETAAPGPQGPGNGAPQPGGVVVTPSSSGPDRVSPTPDEPTSQPTAIGPEQAPTRTRAPGPPGQVPRGTPHATPTDRRPGRGEPPAATQQPTSGETETEPLPTETAVPEPTPTVSAEASPPMSGQTPPGPQGTHTPEPQRTPPGPGNGGPPPQPSRTPGPRS